MTTTEALIVLIKALPEIEFTEVFEEMAGHLNKNKWHHLTNGLYSVKITELEERVEELEEEVRDAENSLDEALNQEDAASEKVKELEQEIEDLKQKITELESK